MKRKITDKGKYPAQINGVATPCYNTWKQMHGRVYRYTKENPTYSDCIICPEWFYFQTFAVWYHSNYREGFHIDKDILIKGNKIYGPEFCIFVPQALNSLFTDMRKRRGPYPQGVTRTTCIKESYSATLTRYRKKYHLGCFGTPEEAFSKYKTAKEKHVKQIAREHYLLDNIDLRTLKALLEWEL